MTDFYRKYARTLLDMALLLATTYIVLRLAEYFYGIVQPLFWSLLILACFEPLALVLQRWGVPKAIAAAMALLLLVLIFLVLIGLLGYFFVDQIIRLSALLPSYSHTFAHHLNEDLLFVQHQLNARGLNVDLYPQVSSVTALVSTHGSEWLSIAFMSLVHILSSFSDTFYNILLGTLLAYFLSLETSVWTRVIRRSPTPIPETAHFLRHYVFHDIFRYIRAQVVLAIMTFGLCIVPTFILHVGNAVFISLLVAISSMVPIVGIAASFVPWILYLLVTGQGSLSLWILGLFLVISAIRQVVDPKVIGDALGVSAFVMLLLIILFGSLFGALGVLLAPFMIILVNQIYRQGHLAKWIHLPDREPEDRIQGPLAPDSGVRTEHDE